MQNQTDMNKASTSKPVDPTNITKHGEERAPEKASKDKMSKSKDDAKGGDCGCG